MSAKFIPKRQYTVTTVLETGEVYDQTHCTTFKAAKSRIDDILDRYLYETKENCVFPRLFIEIKDYKA